MSQQIYTKISKHLNIPKETLFFEKLTYDENGFIIYLSDAKTTKLISINFNFVLFYRGIDESNLLIDIEQSPEIGFWSLYEVTDSQLISDFHKLSLGINEDIQIRHFAVYTQDECIDILSPDKPIIEIKNILNK